MSARSSGSRDSKPQPRGLALVISEPETADTWQDQVLLGMLVDSSLVLGPASEEEPSACDTLSYCPTESPRSPSMTHSGDHHMVTLTDSGENADSQVSVSFTRIMWSCTCSKQSHLGFFLLCLLRHKRFTSHYSHVFGDPCLLLRRLTVAAPRPRPWPARSAWSRQLPCPPPPLPQQSQQAP